MQTANFSIYIALFSISFHGIDIPKSAVGSPVLQGTCLALPPPGFRPGWQGFGEAERGVKAIARVAGAEVRRAKRCDQLVDKLQLSFLAGQDLATARRTISPQLTPSGWKGLVRAAIVEISIKRDC